MKACIFCPDYQTPQSYDAYRRDYIRGIETDACALHQEDVTALWVELAITGWSAESVSYSGPWRVRLADLRREQEGIDAVWLVWP